LVARDAARNAKETKAAAFAALVAERVTVAQAHAAEVQSVCDAIVSRFSGQIRFTVVPGGVTDSLDAWVREQKQKGLTQWWNGVREPAFARVVTPAQLLRALDEQALTSDPITMSQVVAQSFTEHMNDARRRELSAMRNEDLYVLQYQVSTSPEEYRDIDKLSGGQQVGLLLSLVLEMEDCRPLVIDQPEDELDKAFLLETLLPTLRRLKGRRQIIFATHDANLVVNGDADQVICLEADASQGRIAAQGAIESDGAKKAIIHVLDGGKDAFELRQAKYGF